MTTIVDEVLRTITAALHQLRPPDWTRHEDLKDRSPSWWIDQMHPQWMAEEYLTFLSPNRPRPTRADRVRVKRISDLSRDLADDMKRCNVGELTERFHATRSDHPLDRPMPTFAVIERALDRLAEAADQVEFEISEVPRELAVAQLAASHFNRVTWREPGLTTDKIDGKAKASGQFLEFVKDVYRALGITASAERNAKKAAAAFKLPKSFEEQYPELAALRKDANASDQPK